MSAGSSYGSTGPDAAVIRPLGVGAPERGHGPRCVECGRVFNLAFALDADEWAYGHDCEVAE